MKDFANAPVPKGLSSHPGLYDIYVLLCSGWTAPRTASFVTRKYNVHTKSSDVAEYLHNIPASAFLEPNVDHRQDFVIDYIYEMNELLRGMKDRLSAITLLEERNKPHDTTYERAARLYFEMLLKYATALERLRITPQLRDALQTQAVQQAPSLRELASESLRSGNTSNTPKLLGPGDKGTGTS